MTAVEPQQRLAQLYELSKLFARFETLSETFGPALAIAARSLSLRSAILMESADPKVNLTIWPEKGRFGTSTKVARAHAHAAYQYLVAPPGPEAVTGSSLGADTSRFIVIPITVAYERTFGILQFEGEVPFDEADLKFAIAIAGQLATALDRHRSWRRDLAHLGEAEARRAAAEEERERYRLLAEEARRAVGMREQILAIVSHDLRSPLATIQLAASMLGDENVRPERRAALPVRIQRSVLQMTRLIEDLLDFASIEAGKLAVKRHLQKADPLLGETLAAYEGAASEKQIQLSSYVDPQLPTVAFDRGRVLQVLSNLVGNAVKVTREGGEIALALTAMGNVLVFAVSDTGPGISDDDARHLFDRYWRADSVEYKGTGLGLSIASGIVRAHGGKIWVDSVLGQGSTFYFTVPPAAVAATSA